MCELSSRYLVLIWINLMHGVQYGNIFESDWRKLEWTVSELWSWQLVVEWRFFVYAVRSGHVFDLSVC